MGVFSGVLFDIRCQIEKLFDLIHRKIQRIQKMSHLRKTS